MTTLLRMATEVVPAIVGALHCQKNSFAKEFQTVIVRCEEDVPVVSTGKKNKNKEPLKNKKYAVELADTILFPEGGGQPSDQGYIVDSSGKKHFVEYIKRDKLRAVHLVDEPIEVGTPVTLELDWKKRLDHMQQHTGQHLLSAVLDKRDVNSLSWSMGEMVNYLELPRALTDEEVASVSEEVNEKIMEAIPISVEIPGNEDVNQEKIPDDYDVEKGVLRVIKIGDLDSNPCCGTHLQSTAQIVSIALLHQTSVRGSNSRIHFIAGDRVRQYAEQNHKILKQAGADLSCQFEDLSDKIGQLNMSYRKSVKKEASWREEVANYQSLEIISQFESKDAVFLHRSDAGLDYLNLIFKEVSKGQPEGKVLVLISGEGKEGGSMIINCSNAEKTSEIAKHLQSLIPTLKGGGKAKWQGKVASFGKNDIEKAIDYLESL